MTRLTLGFLMFLLISAFFALQEGFTQTADDPVWVVLQEHDDAVNEYRQQKNPSPETRKAWLQNWKKRFEVAIDQNPHSDAVEFAKMKLLGINNGLGSFGESQSLLQNMIANDSQPEKKIDLYHELGEVARAEYLAHKSPEEAQKSLDSFEKAHELYLSLPPSLKSDGRTGCRQIISLYMAAEITAMLNDHNKSAGLYHGARELFESSTEFAADAVLFHYDLEIIAENEMLEWVKAKKESKAIECLEILSNLKTYRFPPSYYALKYANLQYENNPKGFQNFVSKWLKENAADERTPLLMAQLAFSYDNDGLYEQSLPVYEELRNKYCSDFQKLEPEAFQKGRGGCYDRVLLDLGTIYLRQGNLEGAKEVREELKNLLPNSSYIERLKPGNFIVDLGTLPKTNSKMTWHFWLRGILMVIGIALVVLGVCLRKKKNY